MSGSIERVVHRVASVDEALRFEQCGADVIGVVLSPEVGPWAGDGRAVSVGSALAIGRALRSASLLVELPETVEAVDALAAVTGWVQRPGFDRRRPIRGALAGAPRVMSRVEADHDTDPSWVRSALVESRDLGYARSVVEVGAAFDDGWQAMVDAHGDDSMTLDEMDGLCHAFPLWLSAGLRAHQVSAARARLGAARGWVWSLGGHGRGAVHLRPPDEVAVAVAAMGGGPGG